MTEAEMTAQRTDLARVPASSRRWLVLGGAVLAMLALFALRFIVEGHQNAVLFLMVVPVAAVAFELGSRWGVAMATVATGLFVLWVSIDVDAEEVNAIGYAVHLITYGSVALIVGELARRLHERESQVAESMRLASAMVESSSDAMLLKDTKGRYLMANATLARMFDRSADELIGRTDREVFPAELADRVEAEDRRARESEEPVTFERAITTPSGRELTLQTTKGVIRDDRGRPLAMYSIGRDISDRKREEDLFRGLVSRAPDAMVVTDEGGRIVLVNARAEEMLGYVPGSLVGEPVEVLVPERLRHAHAGHRHGYVSAPKAREMGSELELAIVRSDGSELPVEISLAPLTAGNDLLVSASIRDISERQRTERRAAAQLEATKVMAEQTDVDEALAMLLGTVRETLGWSALAWWQVEEDALEGRRPDSVRRMRLVRSDVAPDCGDLATWLERGKLAEQPELEPVWGAFDADEGPDGSAGTAVWAPVWSADELVGGLQMISLEKRERETGLLELLIAIGAQLGHFVQRREAEIATEEVKNEFFAVISHELRTPLTSIIGYADLLAEMDGESLSEEGRHALEVVQRNAARELRLVRDLLFLVRLQSKTFEVRREPADLSRAVLDAVEGQRPVADASGIELVADLEGLPETMIDSERITQVADNLISNALKFTPRGGHVRVGLSERDGVARLVVDDDGPGIEPDELEHLFERMYRASNAEEMHVPGLGLGLTIVIAITEAHGGHAWIESQVGEGTTATVELPLEDDEGVVGAADRRKETVG